MRIGMLESYADLAIHVGLNLRAGQRLLIIGPLANGGASLEAAPLVRLITDSAYRAGARAVEALWGDEAMQLSRFRLAPPEVVRRVFAVAAGCAAPARRGRRRRSVGLREQPGSTQGRGPAARLGGAAGHLARRASVPGSHLAQCHELVDCGRGRAGLGGAECSPRSTPTRASTRCGTRLPGCAASMNPIRSPRGAPISSASARGRIFSTAGAMRPSNTPGLAPT